MWAFSIILAMATEKCDGDNIDTLPDLPDDKLRKQLVLEQKVFKTNEFFIKRHEDFVEWLLSTEEYHKYPEHAKKNLYGFRKHASKYKYDEKEGMLYRKLSSLMALVSTNFKTYKQQNFIFHYK